MLDNLLTLLERQEEKLFTLGADFNHRELGDDEKIVIEAKKIRETLYAITNKATSLLQEAAVTTATIYSYAQELMNYLTNTFGDDNIAGDEDDNVGDVTSAN